MNRFVTTDSLRGLFAAGMSDMYRQEVPLYGTLLDIVAHVNATVLHNDPALRQSLADMDECARLDLERHGAVRVGTASELALLARIFAVLGMYPVGYYDLAAAGVPVHSTAFRPVDEVALRACPFRIFTSLLRLELIEDPVLRAQAQKVLQRRQIISERGLALLENAERNGGVAEDEAQEFLAEMLAIFRWHSQAIVDIETYRKMHAAHRLVADVAAFQGPHINHLTPRVLDIDAAQAEMVRRGIDAKDYIEGPPHRREAILLRQTSFKALEEVISFPDGATIQRGTHTARFGEIEQRGMALTPKGRALYDACLHKARAGEHPAGHDHDARLRKAFRDFPDDPEDLRQQQLAYFRYVLTQKGKAAAHAATGTTLPDWLAARWVQAIPITYEDFLPISAAGIFRSNLGDGSRQGYDSHGSRAVLEAALGRKVIDPFELYETIQEKSLEVLASHFAAMRAH
ncbi:VOC family protein [Komagataeibacter sucrofermentans]|uniref:2-oxoadipate dioxygenase/decarboxylase n=1 Tax=Komagataeibacter sucrofermentans TaxID=1053551 RepID=A0A318QSN5_9PROT|nr:VOC family protein [Komagataeibacter sucrofermentans]PYD80352.1 DUF1338 domain-containing protein [Komagataeibacter sucrofermentans]GBQ47342.1 hypothetical protein AA15973_1176 [Komagataeibacter sucrofermentans DSM 15973]